MPRFIDVSGGRVQIAEVLAEEQKSLNLPLYMRKGLQELYGGDRHVLVPLGELATTEAAYALADGASRLRMTNAFAVLLESIKPAAGIENLERVILGLDDVDPRPVMLRYFDEVDALAPESFVPGRKYTDPIRAYGGALLTAVATIECPEVAGSQFDALYTPKAWLEFPAGVLPADYQAVRAAASYTMIGMGGPTYEPN